MVHWAMVLNLESRGLLVVGKASVLMSMVITLMREAQEINLEGVDKVWL